MQYDEGEEHQAGEGSRHDHPFREQLPLDDFSVLPHGDGNLLGEVIESCIRTDFVNQVHRWEAISGLPHRLGQVQAVGEPKADGLEARRHPWRGGLNLALQSDHVRHVRPQ
ncbi:hypothetical protein D9M69_684800 [compost metagenome]